MSVRDEGAPAIRLTITPEPTDEETAAIAAVVAALAASGSGDGPRPETPIDRWALAGRHEALRGPLWPAGASATMKGQAS